MASYLPCTPKPIKQMGGDIPSNAAMPICMHDEKFSHGIIIVCVHNEIMGVKEDKTPLWSNTLTHVLQVHTFRLHPLQADYTGTIHSRTSSADFSTHLAHVWTLLQPEQVLLRPSPCPPPFPHYDRYALLCPWIGLMDCTSTNQGGFVLHVQVY